MDMYLSMIFIWPLDWAPQDTSLCQGQSFGITQNQALYSLIGVSYGGSTGNFNIPDLRGRVPVGANTVILPLTPLAKPGGAATLTTNLSSTGNVVIGINNLPAHNHQAGFQAITDSVTVPISQAGNQTVNIPVGTTIPPTVGPTTLSGPQYLSNAASGVNPLKGAFVNSPPASTVSLATTGPGAVTVTGGAGVTANPTINVVTGGRVTVQNTGSGQALPISVTGSLALNNMQPYLGLNFFICLNGLYPLRPS